MKSVALALVLAALLMSLLSLQQWDASPWVVAPLVVLVGIAGASCLQGGISWLSVVLGAVSPLAFRWIDPHVPWLAISALCLLWTAPRIWLARSTRSLAVIAGASLTLSLLAGWIAAAYADEGMLHLLAACIFSGAALSLVTLLVRTDTPIGHALEVTARALDASPARDAILHAAEVHRTRCRERLVDSIPGTGWRRLLALVDRRAAMRRNGDSESESVRKELDNEIVTLAGELTRDEAPAAKPAEVATHAAATPADAHPAEKPAEPMPSKLPDTVIPEQPAPVEASPADNAVSAVEPGLVVNATVP